MKTKLLTLVILVALAGDVIAQIRKRDRVDPIYPESPVRVDRGQPELIGDDIESRLTAFDNARSSAKVLQIIGGVGLTTYFALAAIYEGKVENGDLSGNPPPISMAAVSCGFITIGFIVDSTAGKRLRKRQ